jgi:outer membrane lipoprotein carrier protein
MKQILFSLIAGLLTTTTFAQDNNTFTETSDPAATVILEKIKKEYLSYTSVEIDFTLTIALPEEKEEIQKGKIAQQGDKYRLKMGPQEIFCNGQALWLYLKERNEVQINDANGDDAEEVNIMSPKDLFTLYEKGEYIYGIVNEGKEAGKSIVQIEFKPTDRYSEYTKLRLTIEMDQSTLWQLIK